MEQNFRWEDYYTKIISDLAEMSKFCVTLSVLALVGINT